MKVLIAALMVAVLAVAPAYAVEGDLLDEWMSENPDSMIVPTSDSIDGFLPGSEGLGLGDDEIVPISEDELGEATDAPQHRGDTEEDTEEDKDKNKVLKWALIGGAAVVVVLAVVLVVSKKKSKK